MITLAADIGGTSIKLGLLEKGRVLAHARLKLSDRRHLAPVLTPMAERWRAMLQQTGRTVHEAEGVAIAFAGVVDARRRRVLATNEKFIDAPDLDLRQWTRDVLGLPLWIDNDARAALIGEWWAGAGRGMDDLAMVTLGTGIGAAAVSDGRLVRGRHGLAGMFGGHLTVNLHGRRCTCGNVGCAEAAASTDRLPEIAAAISTQRGLAAPWSTEPSLNYATVFAQAEAGDELAAAVRDHSLAVWSAAVVNIIHAYGPQMVLLGGGIIHGSPWIIEIMQPDVDHHAWTPWGRVKLVRAALGDDAALIGCGFMPQMVDDNADTVASRRPRSPEGPPHAGPR
jgi:glucokinase